MAVCPFYSSAKTWRLSFLQHLLHKCLILCQQKTDTLNGSIDKTNHADEIPFLPNLESYALVSYAGMRSKKEGIFYNTGFVALAKFPSEEVQPDVRSAASSAATHTRTNTHLRPFPTASLQCHLLYLNIPDILGGSCTWRKLRLLSPGSRQGLFLRVCSCATVTSGKKKTKAKEKRREKKCS